MPYPDTVLQYSLGFGFIGLRICPIFKFALLAPRQDHFRGRVGTVAPVATPLTSYAPKNRRSSVASFMKHHETLAVPTHAVLT